MPLANALLPMESNTAAEPKYPLELVYCPNCTLTQITETVPPEHMFSEYTYFSSFSETMLAHARELADHLISTRRLNSNSLVVEIASNDGYLLQYFLKRGIPVLGIEPAANVARVAQQERNIPTISEFFGVDLAERLCKETRQADMILALNVLAHVPDINGFLEGIRRMLKKNGMAVMEVPYLTDLIDQCEFDTIYHEHLSYFSLTALTRLFQKHDLVIVDARRIAIHGGSLRIYASAGGSPDAAGENVQLLIKQESARLGKGVKSAAFINFAERIKKLKTGITTFLTEQSSAGKRIAAYGAAAKGCVFMNYCGLRSPLVEFVVDRNPAKQGKRMPGTHQPIFAPERLLEDRPDFVLILPWNISEEIVRQQSEYSARGGRFVVAVPEVKILS